MAKQTEVQYIQFYTDGSAARKVAPELPKKKKPGLRTRKQAEQATVLRIDPLALCGIAVAAVMLVLLAAGWFQMRDAKLETERMAQYVSELEAEKARLENQHTSGYDADEIRQQALQLGMIPVGETEQITVPVNVPMETPESLTLWQQICAFFEDLFA